MVGVGVLTAREHVFLGDVGARHGALGRGTGGVLTTLLVGGWRATVLWRGSGVFFVDVAVASGSTEFLEEGHDEKGKEKGRGRKK